MKEKIAYGLWACLYILCIGLGFVPEPSGAGKVLLVLTGVIFFLPGAWLLRQAILRGDRKGILRIRLLSLASLVLTVAVLALNFLSVRWSPQTGKNLYELLVVVSSPMVCCQYWVLSLFLWACLLVATFRRRKS